MKNEHLGRPDVAIISEVDLSRPSGDTFRVAILASELKKNGMEVSLVVPRPNNNEHIIDLDGVEVVEIPMERQIRSMTNLLKRARLLVKKAKEYRKRGSLIHVESSTLGGYIAAGKISDYILDIHGLVFDETRFSTPPWYIPNLAFRKYTYLLERMAARRAGKIIAVSGTMADFIHTDWSIPRDRIEVIPNGFLEERIAGIEGIEGERGVVTFVGLLEKWANVDKVIEAANKLRNEDVTFRIVGDGPHREELEHMCRRYDLRNVEFTGFVPMKNAFEFMARSEILLAPFPKTLALDVACPIKLLEYMALGKPMVVDNVGDIPAMLDANGAALASDPREWNEFAENIRKLLHDGQQGRRIAKAAKTLSKDYTWAEMGKRMADVIKGYHENGK